MDGNTPGEEPDASSGGAPTDGAAPEAAVSDCVLEGTWASFITVPVTWPQAPLILLGGEGELIQWVLSRRFRRGDSGYEERVVPCGIFLPDLTADILGGFARFGIRFPDALFDAARIPEARYSVDVDRQTGEFTSEPFAILIGHEMRAPLRAAWPPAPLMPLDPDRNGRPGATVIPVSGQGTGYDLPPVDIFGTRADLVDLVTRTVSKLRGETVSCDESHGQVEILNVAGTPGINSAVIGCRRQDGNDCTEAEWNFIDVNRPQFTPTGPGTVVSVRVAEAATCSTVRELFPRSQ